MHELETFQVHFREKIQLEESKEAAVTESSGVAVFEESEGAVVLEFWMDGRVGGVVSCEIFG